MNSESIDLVHLLNNAETDHNKIIIHYYTSGSIREQYFCTNGTHVCLTCMLGTLRHCGAHVGYW